jgi:aspartokinase
MNEITLIIDSANAALAGESFPAKPLFRSARIACVWMKFDEQYLSTPGFLFDILQQFALQGINVIELASTTTELLVYLDRKDTRLAFDTLYSAYVEPFRG